MPQLSDAQAIAMMDNGFRHGLGGYPVLFAENGHVTIVEEKRTHLIVWEFSGDGGVQKRRYLKEGKSANISPGG
jgi:hypothetical protein